jgi:hypothetical protein
MRDDDEEDEKILPARKNPSRAKAKLNSKRRFKRETITNHNLFDIKGLGGSSFSRADTITTSNRRKLLDERRKKKETREKPKRPTFSSTFISTIMNFIFQNIKINILMLIKKIANAPREPGEHLQFYLQFVISLESPNK